MGSIITHIHNLRIAAFISDILNLATINVIEIMNLLQE